MDIHSISDQLSDEEIFIGRLTLQEVKKRLLSASPLPLSHRQTVGVVDIDCKDDRNSSIKIIETHSAPDISSRGDLHHTAISKSDSTPGLSPENFCDWDIKPDDSFLKLEQMVANMHMIPDNYEMPENIESKKFFFNNQREVNSSFGKPKLPFKSDVDNVQVPTTEQRLNVVFKTPLKNNEIPESKLLDTPRELYITPSSKLKSKVPIFKTPGNPSSHKKQLATPTRKFQNVVSPVATYIRNSPQVPLLKDVCPKRPLLGASSIPKPLKHFSQINKENIKHENVKSQQENMKLPAVAYRTAKETKMINIPDESKMPQNHWAKQVASSIPRALVVKHSHRETGSTKKPLNSSQENSFADLSLHQADLSVCTQKPTFSKPKKNI